MASAVSPSCCDDHRDAFEFVQRHAHIALVPQNPVTGDAPASEHSSQVVNIPNSMTVLPEMLPTSIDLAERSLVGTLNFTNPGVLSHNQVLELYRDHIDRTFTWENFTGESMAGVSG